MRSAQRPISTTPSASAHAVAGHAHALRFALALALTALALLAPGFASGQDMRTVSKSRQFNGEDLLRVDVEYAAGQLSVGPAAPTELFRAVLRYDADGFEPRLDYSGNRLRAGIEGGEIRGKNLRSAHLDMKLGPRAPIDLRLAFGAAEANIELGGLRIRNAEIQTGASKTTLRVSHPNPDSCRRISIQAGAARFEAIGLGNLNTRRFQLEGGVGEMILDFTGQWRGDTHGTVEMGLGTLTIRVPRGLGVRIRKDGLLAPFDSEGLMKRGDAFYSDGFERAPHKLTLDVEAALGSIRVVWVDN